MTSEGVNVRVTIGLYPPANAFPYMHAKTMIVDGRIAYVGSIDLDTTEASQDRELGIQFRLPALVRQLNAQFQSDWQWPSPPGVTRLEKRAVGLKRHSVVSGWSGIIGLSS